ncbi:MAG: hypothetical protein K0S36_2471 [Nitrosospira multiformis]|jgi:hypothetical protein|nr:hypothetical protein [Nitrosospira multiformis]
MMDTQENSLCARIIRVRFNLGTRAYGLAIEAVDNRVDADSAITTRLEARAER